MKFFTLASIVLASTLFVPGASVLAQVTLRYLHFERSVRPLLVERCQSCHGAEEQKAGLRLDSHEAVLKGSDSGSVVVPGDPEASRLVAAIRHQGEIQMPPDGKLGDSEVETLVRWIEHGAVWPERTPTRAPRKPGSPLFSEKEKSFWSFQPVADVPLPEVKDSGWPSSPIDNFVLARLEDRGLAPMPVANRETLLRRVTYDLTGLPPSETELMAFLQDDSEEAFATVVDRLLGSPHYGERWGRHWMDVARFAESAGHDGNNAYMYAFRYRDYVIDAFNKDKPFDEFVVEQLAGDLLPKTGNVQVDYDREVATGFLQVGPKPVVMRNKHQMLLDIADEQVDTTGIAFLGMTLGCARCHDHKFDPIPTQDYYSLAGIFMNTHVMRDFMADSKWITPEVQSPSGDLVKILAVRDLPLKQRGDLHVHIRGSYENLGEPAPRRFLQIVSGEDPPPIETEASGRRELAHWIANSKNPLTARVFVNRVWQWHFGRGIVASSGDFGIRGDRPTHPRLLDFLARWFVEHGWSTKKLHRLLLLSSTYRQASMMNPEAAAKDPENTLLWRFPRRRLSAEEIRDSLLAAGGALDRKMGGTFFDYKAIQAGGDPKRELYALGSRPRYLQPRRAVYIPVVRNFRPYELTIFDAANEHLSTGLRRPTVVAPQALYLMNSSFVRRQASNLATDLLDTFGEKNVPGLTTAAYRRVLGRDPFATEVQDAQRFLATYRDIHNSIKPKSESVSDSFRVSRPTTYSDVILTSPGLRVYYRFEEAAPGDIRPTTHISNAVNNGTGDGKLTGDDRLVSEGAFSKNPGRALSFRGDGNRVKLTDTAILNAVHNKLSLEYWVNPNKVQASMVAGRDTGGSGSPRLWKSGIIPATVDGVQKNVVYSDLLCLKGFLAGTDGRAVAEIGRWTHVVMTYDGILRTLWVNGVKIQEQYEPGSLLTNIDRPGFTIGATDNGSESFSGSVDEVAVYARALHPGEIKQHYAIGRGRLDASEFKFPALDGGVSRASALDAFCQTLFWMNEFLYVE